MLVVHAASRQKKMRDDDDDDEFHMLEDVKVSNSLISKLQNWFCIQDKPSICNLLNFIVHFILSNDVRYSLYTTSV